MFDVIDKSTMELIEDTIKQAIGWFDDYAEQHDAKAAAVDATEHLAGTEAGEQIKIATNEKAERNRNRSQFLADRLQAIKDSLTVANPEPAPVPALVELTDEDQFILDWLSKEETSQVGECEGKAFGRLLGFGLAELGPEDPRGEQYRTVKLTDKGKALVSKGIS